MTREEAIQVLQTALTSPLIYGEYAEAIDMAIEALSAEGVGRYENAMQKLREMPKYLNGVKAKQIQKIPSDAIQGEWISCSERLPNEDGEYLVFYEGTIIGAHIDIMWYAEPLMPNVDVSGKHFYRSDSEWGDIIYDEVIAWMPLPKPYREESEVEE